MDCRKKTFDTQQLAEHALKEIFIINELDPKNKPFKVPVREYQCEYCQKWHLTSKSKGLYKEILKKKETKLEKFKAIKEDWDTDYYEGKLSTKHKLRIR